MVHACCTHVLTRHKLQIIVFKTATKMNASRESDLESKLKTGLCVSLALLFLYNPYLALISSSSSLNVRHTASYRATVGFSELQHFSPTDARKTFAVQPVILFDWFERPLNLSAGETIEEYKEHSPACKILCADLWFRPPPVL